MPVSAPCFWSAWLFALPTWIGVGHGSGPGTMAGLGAGLTWLSSILYHGCPNTWPRAQARLRQLDIGVNVSLVTTFTLWGWCLFPPLVAAAVTSASVLTATVYGLFSRQGRSCRPQQADWWHVVVHLVAVSGICMWIMACAR